MWKLPEKVASFVYIYCLYIFLFRKYIEIVFFYYKLYTPYKGFIIFGVELNEIESKATGFINN